MAARPPELLDGDNVFQTPSHLTSYPARDLSNSKSAGAASADDGAHGSEVLRGQARGRQINVSQPWACDRSRAAPRRSGKCSRRAEVPPLVADLWSGNRVCRFRCGRRSHGCATSPSLCVDQQMSCARVLSVGAGRSPGPEMIGVGHSTAWEFLVSWCSSFDRHLTSGSWCARSRLVARAALE